MKGIWGIALRTILRKYCYSCTTTTTAAATTATTTTATTTTATVTR